MPTINEVDINRIYGLSDKGQDELRGLAYVGALRGKNVLMAAPESGKPPVEVQQFFASKSGIAAAIVRSIVPDKVTTWVTETVKQTERDLNVAYKNLSRLNATQQTKAPGTPDPILGERNRQYQQARQKHNAFKFWCALIPPFRDRLKGKTLPPQLDQLRASDASIAQFVAEHANDTIADLKRQGAVVEQLNPRVKNDPNLYDEAGRAYPRKDYGLAGALGDPITLTTGIIIAGVIAAAYVAYIAVTEIASTLRVWSDNAVLKDTAAKEAKGELAPGTTTEIAKQQAKKAEEKRKESESTNPFAALTKALPWLVGGAAVILLGPPIITAITAKRAAAPA